MWDSSWMSDLTSPDIFVQDSGTLVDGLTFSTYYLFERRFPKYDFLLFYDTLHSSFCVYNLWRPVARFKKFLSKDGSIFRLRQFDRPNIHDCRLHSRAA